MVLKKRLFNCQSGVTLIELLVAVAIIIIISGAFLIQIRITDTELVEITTEQVASDLRQIRSLAISRIVAEVDSGDREYPKGGYGMYFNDNDTPSYYILFADNGDTVGFQPAEDETVYRYIFTDNDLTIYPTNETGTNQFYYTFVTEHYSDTDISYSDAEGFSVTIEKSGEDRAGIIQISDTNYGDDYVWGHIFVRYVDN